MALSTTDKGCLSALHGYLVKREAKGLLTTEERQHFESIKTGEEADRIAAAKWYAEHIALVRISDRLATIDAEKAALQAEESALQAYIA